MAGGNLEIHGNKTGCILDREGFETERKKSTCLCC